MYLRYIELIPIFISAYTALCTMDHKQLMSRLSNYITTNKVKIIQYSKYNIITVIWVTNRTTTIGVK